MTVFESARPSGVQTAPGASQAAPPASVTVTSASESGLTVTSHRSLRPSTRFAFFTLPPDTDNDWSRNVRKPIAMPSLNAILSLNAVFPSCSAGARANRAVSTPDGASGATSSIVPFASGTVTSTGASEPAECAFDSRNTTVSASSASSSRSTRTSTVLRVRPGANVTVPRFAV